MTCNEIRELMPDLAVGFNSVTPEINEHLHACANCAGTLEEFRQTMALLDEWQAPEPSPYFDTRLNARLREEMAKQPAGWFHWVRKPALAVSLAAMMVVSATLLRTDGGIHVRTRAKDIAGISATFEQVEPGTAVGDLQALDRNHELYSDFDVLDELQVQQDVTANQ
jgi:hypothetical protein